jgi:hypothetical protein
MVPRTRVVAADAMPTISEFKTALRNSADAKTCSYQRKENPVNGKESDGLS